MKVLVTGGAGFIGSHLVKLLISQGHTVAVFDNLSTGKKENVPGGAALHVGDLLDRDRFRRVCVEEKPESVIHLAAQANVRTSLAQPTRDLETNLMGGMNVLLAGRDGFFGRLVFASSGGAIYGDQKDYPCRECSVAEPRSPYGISKLAFERYADCLKGDHFEVTHLRVGNVYGPGQDPRGEAGVVAIFTEAMLSGDRPRIFGDGRQTRDYVYVGDVARAFALALRGPQGIYNIGTGRETCLSWLFERLAQATGFRGSPTYLPPVPGELRRNVLDCEWARRRLRWEPKIELREGLSTTVDWFRAHSSRERARHGE